MIASTVFGQVVVDNQKDYGHCKVVNNIDAFTDELSSVKLECGKWSLFGGELQHSIAILAHENETEDGETELVTALLLCSKDMSKIETYGDGKYATAKLRFDKEDPWTMIFHSADDGRTVFTVFNDTSLDTLFKSLGSSDILLFNVGKVVTERINLRVDEDDVKNAIKDFRARVKKWQDEIEDDEEPEPEAEGEEQD